MESFIKIDFGEGEVEKVKVVEEGLSVMVEEDGFESWGKVELSDDPIAQLQVGKSDDIFGDWQFNYGFTNLRANYL
jgi:hypothetical protein